MRRENEKVKKHLESEFKKYYKKYVTKKSGLKPIGKAPMPGAPSEIPEPVLVLHVWHVYYKKSQIQIEN